MKISRSRAAEMAQDFLARRNPENWDGYGKMPATFSQATVKYDIGIPNHTLSIFFAQSADEDLWEHCCGLSVNGEEGTTFTRLRGHGINSVLTLVETILDICLPA